MSLYLQEFNGEGANPCCNMKNYRASVTNLFPKLSCLDGQRTANKQEINMKQLGLEHSDNEEELDYDMEGQQFYDDEIKHVMSFNVTKVQVGKEANREIISFKNLVTECDSILDRKQSILKL